jgi:hypothetical protein
MLIDVKKKRNEKTEQAELCTDKAEAESPRPRAREPETETAEVKAANRRGLRPQGHRIENNRHTVLWHINREYA